MPRTTKPLVSMFAIAAFGLAVAATPAFAAGDHDGGHDEGHGNDGMGHSDSGGHHHDMAFGEPGEPGTVDRTVDVVMTDTAYNFDELEVRDGQTIRFRVRNEGRLVHEFGIATPHMHAEHREEMKRMMNRGMMTTTEIKKDSGHGHGMAHDDPNSVLLEPGEEATLIWKFRKAGRIEFACNVPGHYKQGMHGRIHVHPASAGQGS